MRPEEIDYSDTRKHYFDLSNGEVLAGRDERHEHIEAGAKPEHIMKIGALLRNPEPYIDLGSGSFEPLDTNGWPRDRYAAFARWLYRTVDPPEPPQTKQVTKTVFRHARLLGVGPGHHAVRREFGNHSALYREARLADTHAVGTFDDWNVDDAVAYIRKLGGEGPPTTEDIDRRSRSNPNNPSAILLWDRFRDIGGISRLVELAGYPVIKRWSREDYIDWGVRFMRANDGQVPTARMADYLSQKHRGPTASTIVNHFDLVSSFQAEVIPRYYEQKQEAEAHDREQLQKIEAGLQAGALPLELFSPFSGVAEDEDDAQDRAAAQELERLYADRTVASVIDQLGARETIVRYAKFRVLEEVAPWLGVDAKLMISRGLSERNFVGSITKVRPIPAGDIEYAALLEGLFDYIWPDDAQVEALELDEGYRDYLAALESRNRQRRRNKRDEELAAAA